MRDPVRALALVVAAALGTVPAAAWAEPAHTVEVTIDPPDGESGFAVARVRIGEPADRDVVLEVTGVDGTAVQGPGGFGDEDYTAPATVVVPAGSATAVFGVGIRDDDIYEPDETATVTVREPGSGAEGTATLTIPNDDERPAVEVRPFVTFEGAGGVTVRATVIGAAQQPIPWTLTVAGSSGDGWDAAEPDDFDSRNLETTGVIAPGAGELAMGTLDVPLDGTDEFTEGIAVTLTPEGLDPGTGYGRVYDWETEIAPGVSVTGPVTVTEGETAEVPVELDFAAVIGNSATRTEKPVSVDWVAADADGREVAYGTLALTEPGARIRVPTAQDDEYEPDETLTVTLVGRRNASAIIEGESSVTIVDDDQPPALDLVEGEGAEGEALDIVAVPTGTATKPMTYEIDAAGDTSTAILPPGARGPLLLDSVPLPADTVDEDDGELTVTVGNLTVPGAPETRGVYRILDDPADRPPTVTLGRVTVDESAPYAELPVRLVFGPGNGATSTERAVGVAYEVVPGAATPADYQAPPVTRLTIPPGETGGVIRIPLIDDRRTETAETFQVRVTEVTPDGATVGADPGVVTIAASDEDLPRPSITVTGPAAVAESDDAAVFRVALTEPAAGDVDLVVRTRGGTATEGRDYDDPPGTAVIPEGATATTVTVPIRADSLYEGEENAQLTVALAEDELDAVGGPAQAGLVITDDDPAPTVTLTTTSATVSEGDTVELTGRVDGVAQRDFELPGLTGTDSADHELTGGPIRIPVGTRNGATISLGTIHFTNDTVDEDPSLVTVSFGTNTATFTITDAPEDIAPEVSIGDATVRESDGAAHLDVDLAFTGGATSTERTVTVPWQTADATAVAGADYTNSSGTATITPPATDQTIAVPILDDTNNEKSKHFIVRLEAPSPAEVRAARPSATVTIEDDDDIAAPTLTASAPSITGAGRVTLTGTAPAGARVDLLTATGASDFVVLATTTADDAGRYRFTPLLTVGRRLRTRVDGLTSPIRTVQVRQDPALTATATGKAAATLTVTGDPAVPGQQVRIQRQVRGQWRDAATGRLGATGRYTATIRSLATGRHVFRAVIAATPSLGVLAGTSPTRTIRVR